MKVDRGRQVNSASDYLKRLTWGHIYVISHNLLLEEQLTIIDNLGYDNHWLGNLR